MGLKIVHDGTSDGDIAENCCMCRAPTRFWHGKGDKNVALCPACAKKHKASELPSKKAWCARESVLSKFGRINQGDWP